MRVDVSDLKAKLSKPISFDIQGNWSYLTTSKARIPIVAPINVQGKIDNTGRTLYVSGQVSTVLELVCDRCLKSFNYPLGIPLQEEYASSGIIQELAKGDLEDKELRAFDGEFIDLKPAVEDAIILALPMKMVCSDDCCGLCSICGCNLNEGQCQCTDDIIDPRLAPLKKLLRKREGEK